MAECERAVEVSGHTSTADVDGSNERDPKELERARACVDVARVVKGMCILDDVDTAGLETWKEDREAWDLLTRLVSPIVDDDVGGSDLVDEAVQKFAVSLIAHEDPDVGFPAS